MSHAPEPWKVHRNGDMEIEVADAENAFVASVVGEVPTAKDNQNAERIVACINACAGVSTERLMQMVGHNGDQLAAAPELLAALEQLLDWCREHTSPIQPNSPHELLVAAHHAIAKAKGEPSE